MDNSHETPANSPEVASAIAVLKQVVADLKPLFPELRDVSLLSLGTDYLTLFGYIGDGYDSVAGSGATFAEAAAELRKKIPSIADRATKMREEARALIAKADALAPQTEAAS